MNTDRDIIALFNYGGGMRGLIPAHIMARIEDVTGLRMVDMVDIFSGPSTGAILNAALKLFSSFGYHGTSMRDIAEEAKVSTGNVYPLWPVDSPGPSETDPVGPVGEYAQSALARERLFQHGAAHYGTRVAILRINYAVEPRYGVLRDLADQVRTGEAIDLTTGWVNLIWQRDANAIALRALAQVSAPPFILNVTGRPAVRIRDLATTLAAHWGLTPTFVGREAPTALLSDAARAEAIFGAAPVGVGAMIEAVAAWIDEGGASLGKPTRYTEREGRF